MNQISLEFLDKFGGKEAYFSLLERPLYLSAGNQRVCVAPHIHVSQVGIILESKIIMHTPDFLLIMERLAYLDASEGCIM